MMKITFLSALAAVAVCLSNYAVAADDKSDVSTELQQIVGKIQGKLKEGKKTQADLAPDLSEFDQLLAKHKDEKTDDLAQVRLMKAMLYLQVLDDTDKGMKELETLKKDFPQTKPGKDADQIIESVKAQEETKKITRTLVEGAKFPDFQEKDLTGKPLSIANYKGKVVMLDFWATWCGPCVNELPNVLKTYEKHHAQGFEIIGISLDRDEQKLTSFIKDRKMPWVQFFDGKMWSNKLAVKYGVNSIPMTYLLDGEGKIIGRGLRGENLENAVSKALAKN